MLGFAFKESLMTRSKLLLVAVAVLVSTLAGRPVKSDICPGVGVCRECLSPTPEQQPCVRNLCTGVYTCLSTCSSHCVPPPS
jgi:hypothetical protein